MIPTAAILTTIGARLSSGGLTNPASLKIMSLLDGSKPAKRQLKTQTQNSKLTHPVQPAIRLH